MFPYQMPIDQLINEFQVNINRGLKFSEAEQRLLEYGENTLPTEKAATWWEILIDQFRDFMVLVLLGATLLSGLLGEYIDAITIIAIVCLNAVLGFYQEYKAELSLDALRQLISPKAWVIRDGKYQEIYAHDLVPGDLVSIEGGARVPADLRIVDQNSLEIVEAELTGESEAVKKQTEQLNYFPDSLGDIKNMAFMGTMVVKGWGTGIVVATGADTEMGKIADMLTDSEQDITPLQRKLSQLGKVLILLCIIVCALVAVLGVLRGEPVYKMFMAGVSLAVAAIPEGLPAVVTISLAIGVQRMMKKNALIRKLPAVETLGSATVICADKTGTLTANRMVVTEVKTPDVDEAASMCFKIAAFCNSAIYENHEIVKGDPTDKAMLQAALDRGIEYDEFLQEYKYEQEIQFDSYRKRMAVLYRREGNQTNNSEYLLMVKGAPEVLIPRCTKFYHECQTKEEISQIRKKYFELTENMAKNALRNIATAYKIVSSQKYYKYRDNLEKLEQDLTFTGIMGIIDPPRSEISHSLIRCRRAGVETKMITGDHRSTAMAIGYQIDLLTEEQGKVIEGKDLDKLTDKELADRIDNIKVFARVSPEHKLKIVSALKTRGNIVAMTGDGVNDAPAVKAADIGIAMGKSGTDVTKGAADLILADDNYATIESAIEEGRGIYDNIKKFIKFLLSCNCGEILTMLFTMLLGLPLPLKPIQILWVNLVTDGLPAIALGTDSKDNDLMHRRAKSAQDSVFSGGLFRKILSRGLLISLVTVFAFVRGLELERETLEFARTMAFSTLVVSQLIYVFECQTESGKISLNKIVANPQLILAVLISFGLFCLVIYFPPLAGVFETYRLSIQHWIAVIILSAIPTVIAACKRRILTFYF